MKGFVSDLVAARGPQNRTHTIWLSDTTGATDEPNSVWYAELRGSTWSKPVEIFRADAVKRVGTGPVILIKNQDVHVLVSFSNRGFAPRGGSGIAHIVRRTGRWSSSTIKRGGLPSSPTGVLVNDTTLLMAFVASDGTGRVDNGSHVFVGVPSGIEPAWAVRRLNWAGLSSSRWPSLFAERGARGRIPTLSLVWTVTGSASGSPDSLFIATSRDIGKTWSAPRAVELGEEVVSVATAMDAAQRIHVVAYSQRRDGEFLYTSWSHEGWSSLQRLDFGDLSSEQTFSPTGGDSLLLFWGERRAASPGASSADAPIGRYALLAPSCMKNR